jgi:hypothetical protein
MTNFSQNLSGYREVFKGFPREVTFSTKYSEVVRKSLTGQNAMGFPKDATFSPKRLELVRLPLSGLLKGSPVFFTQVPGTCQVTANRSAWNLSGYR